VVITARTAARWKAAAEKIAADTGRAVLAAGRGHERDAEVQRCVDATSSGSARSTSCHLRGQLTGGLPRGPDREQ